MSRQMLFYGLANLFLGIVIFVVFALYLPGIISSTGAECRDEGMFSCGWLESVVMNVAILISIIGIVQILYWVFFEKEKEDVRITATAAVGGAPGRFKVCPKCHATNDLSAKFCSECGADLQIKK